jgi:aminopeptidase N
MRILLLLSFLCCMFGVQAQRPVDVLHYRFEVTLNDSSNVITGIASISLKLNKPTDTMVFDLASINPATNKGMQVTKVMWKDVELGWRHSKDQLRVENAADSDGQTITIFYHGVPGDGLIIATNKFGDRTFFADNWPDRAHNWIPCVDDPADKASFEFIVTAPLHYEVISNGVQAEETILNDKQKLTHWKETIPLSTKIMVIGVAKFAVQYVGDTLGVPVYSWVYPQERANAFYDYGQAAEILPFFINNIAPYPYRKLANVQSKTIFGGMENAGCIFYNENAISGNRKIEDLLTHEIAHQWFGDMASEKSFAHLWLSEGFATYMTDLYIGSKYGVDSMNRRLKQERMQVIAFAKRTMSPVVDTATKKYMQLLNANSYQKGAWALHMLRDQLGADVFMKGVRAYYKRYAGGNASTDDLRSVLEEVSGKDLKAFFNQWLYTPGQPVLREEHSFDPKKNSLSVTITQQQANVFSFPLEIEIGTAKGPVRKTLQVSKASQQFIITGVTGVKSITLDPAVKLLFSTP